MISPNQIQRFEEDSVALTDFVDVCRDPKLFRSLDTDRVVELSRLGGRKGFSCTNAVERSTGTETRRLLAHGVAPLNVAIELCDQLQQRIGFEWADCPNILLCHSHTDPREARKLGEQLAAVLGIAPSAVRAFNFGCTGFLKLLRCGIECLQGMDSFQHVPLICVETPESWHDAADRLFCGIVSSGNAATTIWKGPGHTICSLDVADRKIPKSIHYDGSPLFYRDDVEGFDFDGRPVRRCIMRMNAEPVFVNGIELMLEGVRCAVEAVRYLSPDARLLAVPHQPSGKLIRALIDAAHREVPHAEFLNNLRRNGNTISSTIPLILSRLNDVVRDNEFRRVMSGDLIMLVAAGICMERMDDHMASGQAVIRWQPDAWRLADQTTSIPDIQHSVQRVAATR